MVELMLQGIYHIMLMTVTYYNIVDSLFSNFFVDLHFSSAPPPLPPPHVPASVEGGREGGREGGASTLGTYL